MTRYRLALLCVGAAAVTGCQQKMADQPAPRAYRATTMFPDGQSARPLEQGVVYRGQPATADGYLGGLTAKGRAARSGDAAGAAAYDLKSVVPPKGAPDSTENYVSEFPFPMTEADFERGQQRFNVYCALCHGAAGAGDGKIVERGFLRPPSYHVDPLGKAGDYSTMADASRTEAGAVGLPQGHSRGFYRYGQKVRLDQVPVGYIYSVITWGYGGMADHASQIPVDDRWRIAAYIRALQLSQGAVVADLPANAKKKAMDGLAGKKPAADAHGH